jgi:ribosomal protein S18 acetylase RimI-like enzyme
MLTIRPSLTEDRDKIWEILYATIKEGNAFAYSPDSTKEEMLDYWFAKGKRTYTALLENNVVGTFFIQDNQPGLGSHIANAGYCTSPKFYGQGIGRHMGQFSLEEARKLGYKAMQFNIVVKTNAAAVKLWQELGFQIIGEIPDAFQHQKLGLVNAYVMYQKL